MWLTMNVWTRAYLTVVFVPVTVAIIACSAPPPTATPQPTPTLTPSPELEEALGELFWIAVDWVGEASQAPGINRTLDFETAKSVVKDFLFRLYIGNLDTIEGYGVVPEETLPYCTGIISGSSTTYPPYLRHRRPQKQRHTSTKLSKTSTR